MKVLFFAQFLPLAIADNLTSVVVQLLISGTTLLLYYENQKRKSNISPPNCVRCYYRDVYYKKSHQDEPNDTK